MQMSHYMHPNLVIFSQADTRDVVLHELVHHIYEQGILEQESIFYQAIIDREKIVSTGIGMGVAIPHAKLPGFDQFFIAIGVLQKPVEWNALDGAPVRLIFMIGGPDDKQTEYLQILSQLTQAIKDEDLRQKLLTSQNPQAMIELFRSV